MDGGAGVVEHWEIDPRVIRAIPSCPDHAVDVDLAAVREADDAIGDADDSRLQLDAEAPRQAARARPDQRVPSPKPATEPALNGLLDEARLREPPEQVAAQKLLRQRLLPRTYREQHAVSRRQFLRDLVARISAADDEGRAVGHICRPHVAAAVRLEHVRGQLAREPRNARGLKGAGGYHDLVAHKTPAV